MTAPIVVCLLAYLMQSMRCRQNPYGFSAITAMTLLSVWAALMRPVNVKEPDKVA